MHSAIATNKATNSYRRRKWEWDGARTTLSPARGASTTGLRAVESVDDESDDGAFLLALEATCDDEWTRSSPASRLSATLPPVWGKRARREAVLLLGTFTLVWKFPRGFRNAYRHSRLPQSMTSFVDSSRGVSTPRSRDGDAAMATRLRSPTKATRSTRCIGCYKSTTEGDKSRLVCNSCATNESLFGRTALGQDAAGFWCGVDRKADYEEGCECRGSR